MNCQSCGSFCIDNAFFFSLSSQFLKIRFPKKFPELAKSSPVLPPRGQHVFWLHVCSPHLQSTCAWFAELGCVPLAPQSPSPPAGCALLLVFSWPQGGSWDPWDSQPVGTGEGLPITGEWTPRLARDGKTGSCISNALKSVFPRAHQLTCCVCGFQRSPWSCTSLPWFLSPGCGEDCTWLTGTSGC